MPWKKLLACVTGQIDEALRQKLEFVLEEIFQGQDFHQGSFHAGTMHGLCCLPQSLLREPLRVSRVTGDFSRVAGALGQMRSIHRS